MSRRSRKKSNLPKLLGLSTFLAIATGGLGFAMLQSAGLPTPDAYGCYAGVEQANTLVFIDSSEPRWNEGQARSLRNRLDEIYGALSFNEKLSVYTTEGDVVASGSLKPRFHVCGSARTANDLEAIGGAAASEGYLAKQRERLYEKRLAPQLDQLLTLTPPEERRQTSQSPVLETIQSLSRLPEVKPGSRLIVISDLIQNSDSFQFCRTQNDMPPFSILKNRSVYLKRLKPRSLEGVEVEILYLQRHGLGQGELAHCYGEEEIRKFFEDYFSDNGVTELNFVRIRDGYTGL